MTSSQEREARAAVQRSNMHRRDIRGLEFLSALAAGLLLIIAILIGTHGDKSLEQRLFYISAILLCLAACYNRYATVLLQRHLLLQAHLNRIVKSDTPPEKKF